ncbi:hypothetical protein ACWDUE_34375, partial [Streptomyces albogriseolus]
FSGGVKDSGGRVAEAILYPATEAGRRIRGCAPATGPLRTPKGRTRCAGRPTGLRPEQQEGDGWGR